MGFWCLDQRSRQEGCAYGAREASCCWSHFSSFPTSPSENASHQRYPAYAGGEAKAEGEAADTGNGQLRGVDGVKSLILVFSAEIQASGSVRRHHVKLLEAGRAPNSLSSASQNSPCQRDPADTGGDEEAEGESGDTRDRELDGRGPTCGQEKERNPHHDGRMQDVGGIGAAGHFTRQRAVMVEALAEADQERQDDGQALHGPPERTDE